MRSFITLCASILMSTLVFAQAPQKMSYQAVIRNSSNALVVNTQVGMQISILQGAASGTAVYVETQTPTTNTNGLASLEIGGGTVVSGNFANINWANGPYFIKTETDPTGGTNYTITGTSQLLSVPYAFFSGNGIGSVSAAGDTLFLFDGNHIIIPGISLANYPVSQHSCGANNVHNPNLTYGTMTDQDGNTYKTIVIGAQEWMAENLKVSHYRNGELIPIVSNGVNWQALNTGATCWYNNDSASYHCPYGKLYNWAATVDTGNLCPTGWHVPTNGEWNTLINYLDSSANGGNNINVAGGKMKSTGTQYWFPPNTANNSSGFSGLPGGYREPNGAYDGIIYYHYLWSATQINSSQAWGRLLEFPHAIVNITNANKKVGLSVRCIKD